MIISRTPFRISLFGGGSDYPAWFREHGGFDGVTNDMRIAQEEVFGPVVATIDFKDIDEVIAAGNKTMFGLAAAVWTRDIAKAHTVAAGLRAGTVWINCYNVFDPASPFGGFKFSGFGRENGKDVLNLYTETKSVWVNMR